MLQGAGSKQTPIRPAGRPQPIFAPPFDPSDPGGITWTVLPPEYIIAPNPSKALWRGDFGGMTLAQTPPLVPGCNTTPPEMVMTFLLPEYERKWQDIILTEHAWRSYTHFHLADRQNGGITGQAFVELMQYVQSWGNYSSYWGMGTPDGNFGSWADAQGLFMPTLNALQAAGAKTCENAILIVGEELNSCTSPAGLLDIVSHLAPICNGSGIDMWLHFTSNYPSWPIGGQSSVQFWEEMAGLGIKGLCWQGDPADGPGTMSAHMYDSRRYLASADGALRLVAFELLATHQLYGKASEADGRRYSWECNCAPQGIASIPPVMGGGNGFGSYPNGGAI